jgi:hypothetical protein
VVGADDTVTAVRCLTEGIDELLLGLLRHRSLLRLLRLLRCAGR